MQDEELTIEHIEHLIETRYWGKINKFYEGVIKTITDMDFKKQLVNSLEKGYCGFQIVKHRWVYAFSTGMRTSISDLIDKKLRVLSCYKYLHLYMQQDQISILLWQKELSLSNMSSPSGAIVHYIPKDKMKVQVIELRNQMRDLQQAMETLNDMMIELKASVDAINQDAIDKLAQENRQRAEKFDKFQ